MSFGFSETLRAVHKQDRLRGGWATWTPCDTFYFLFLFIYFLNIYLFFIFLI